MAIPKKGTRKITVDNEVYRWLIRKKPTYTQSDYGIGLLHVAIEYIEEPGTTLFIRTDKKHPKDIHTDKVIPVLPSDISKWILEALKLGWKPQEKGPQFSVKIENNKMNTTP